MSSSLNQNKSMFSKIASGIWFLIKSYFISVGIFFTLMFVMILYLASQSNKASQFKFTSAEPLTEKHMLHIELHGQIHDKNASVDDFLAQVFERRNIIYLQELRNAIRFASKDENITGLFIDLGTVETNLATIMEVRRLMDWYRQEAKKPIYFHFRRLSTMGYYLATGADRINMPVSADIFIQPLQFQMTYFADALKKLGVGVNVVRHGKYKSAFEPFVNNKPSQESIEAMTALLDSLRNDIFKKMADGRSKTPQEIEAWFFEGLYTTENAKKIGIIDSISYLNDFMQKALAEMEVKDDIKLSHYSKIVSNSDMPFPTSDDDFGIALIQARGNIILQGAQRQENTITPKGIIPQLKWARENDKVKAVVLRIDSPGGSALASDLIWDEVAKTATFKPVVASMGDVAASGGYYIASAATHIIAEPTTITGSIGVIGMFPHFKEFGDKYGIHFYHIGNSKYKSLFDMGTEPTQEALDSIQTYITHTYDLFVKRVAEGRKLTPQQVDEIAQGRVWTGTQSINNKLVDSLGGLYDGFNEAKRLAGLDENTLYPILRYKRKPTTLADCFERQDDFLECMRELDASVSDHLQSLISMYSEPQLNEVGIDTKKVQELKDLIEQEKVLSYWFDGVSLRHIKL